MQASLDANLYNLGVRVTHVEGEIIRLQGHSHDPLECKGMAMHVDARHSAVDAREDRWYARWGRILAYAALIAAALSAVVGAAWAAITK
jgi:hypothetical protein